MFAALLLALAQEHSALLIVLDDVGAGDISGCDAINELASEGIRYERAYSWPTCTPSRIAMFLGAYPRRGIAHRVGTPGPASVGDLSMNAYQPTEDELLLEDVTLPEVFGAHAGSLPMLVGKWHLGRANVGGGLNDLVSGPYVQGFGWRAGNATILTTGTGATGYYAWRSIDDGIETLQTTYATDAQVDTFLDWWDDTPGQKLGILSLAAAHTPLQTPPGYTPDTDPRATMMQILDYADTRLADVFAAIDLEDTYVIVTSDNGTDDACRPTGGLFPGVGFWKGSTYTGGINVPFIVAGPGIAPAVSQQLVSVIDIPATICDLLEIPKPAAAFPDSCSIFGKPRTWVFAERFNVHAAASHPQPSGYDDETIIRAGWAWRRWDPDGEGPGDFEEALYQLTVDPLEQNPLTPSSFPTVYAAMLAHSAALPVRAP